MEGNKAIQRAYSHSQVWTILQTSKVSSSLKDYFGNAVSGWAQKVNSVCLSAESRTKTQTNPIKQNKHDCKTLCMTLESLLRPAALLAKPTRVGLALLHWGKRCTTSISLTEASVSPTCYTTINYTISIQIYVYVIQHLLQRWEWKWHLLRSWLGRQDRAGPSSALLSSCLPKQKVRPPPKNSTCLRWGGKAQIIFLRCCPASSPPISSQKGCTPFTGSTGPRGQTSDQGISSMQRGHNTKKATGRSPC